MFDSVAPAAPDARRAAAEAIAPDLPRLRRLVLGAIREAGAAGLTADECAVRLKLSPFTTRPRCTELKEAGLIKDSGRRRKNRSGHGATVWEAT
ncbi:MAG: hypothetical protein AB7P52_17670 [Alphaproteobacteria bacterium]